MKTWPNIQLQARQGSPVGWQANIITPACLSRAFALSYHSRMRTFMNLLLVALCGIVLGGCAGSSEPTNRKELEREFQAEFGFLPSQKIAELRCRIVWVGDTWSKWMLFTLDETALQTMISGGFIPADPASLARPWEKVWMQDLTRATPNPNAPKWWRQPGAKQVRIYYKEGHPKDFAGYRCFWIDGETKTVYAASAAWH